MMSIITTCGLFAGSITMKFQVFADLNEYWVGINKTVKFGDIRCTATAVIIGM